MAIEAGAIGEGLEELLGVLRALVDHDGGFGAHSLGQALERLSPQGRAATRGRVP